VKKLKNKGYTYTINLANAEDDGSFACPKCNTSISPEDETENNYEIIDTKIVNNELTELVLTCNKCGCTIKLIGFHQDSNA
jgi:uncharacterized protein with PIN domain